MSKCTGELDLGLRTTWALENRMPLQGGDIRLKDVFGRKICRNLQIRGGIPFASTDVAHRPRSDSLLHFDVGNI